MLASNAKIFLAGHRGMVGAAVCRYLLAKGHDNLLLRTRAELDLCDAGAVQSFFAKETPEVVILAAAKVGGIWANKTHPALFMHENLAIAHNVIHSAWNSGVKRLLFLGSSCIYPRMCPQPIKEEYLLQGSLENTNEAYALAKIVGLKLCQYYREEYGVNFHSAMPTNLYGPGDYYHPEYSHVIPALIRKVHEAKVENKESVTLWGTGEARREFLHVDDLAEGLYALLSKEDVPDWVNLGSGVDVKISELAALIKKVVGFDGAILYDTSRPDGTPRKLLDVSCMQDFGWEAKIGLEAGLRLTYADFVERLNSGDLRSH